MQPVGSLFESLVSEERSKTGVASGMSEMVFESLVSEERSKTLTISI